MQNESLIKLLSETLKFYADEANYKNGMIAKDEGFQAKYILKLVKENEDLMQKYENLFEEFEQKAEDSTTTDDIIKLIEQLKKESE